MQNQTQKSEIIPLLCQEEGTILTPYCDSLGYPTIGTGFKIGPQNADLDDYTFSLTKPTNDVWLQSLVDQTQADMWANADISEAMLHCSEPRRDILTSMAYQMGVTGLAGFHNMLKAIDAEDWEGAAEQMLDSTWAEQTPARAQRHAYVMQSGEWQPTYDF
ncbi:Phage-related lysozyme (muraminidase) [Serratia quinivorans]|uniref:glycoside hydrolase family protein n=1 Tax=Serratia quinivorans TaxID=137545 RepID=UPI00217BEF08|nr:glycoside hydrolase family protein [Serratia quinivorans]CAI1771447.1 Phage-related lysozyme (muraminidase) [Serratia quinivorans]